MLNQLKKQIPPKLSRVSDRTCFFRPPFILFVGYFFFLILTATAALISSILDRAAETYPA